MNKRILFAIVVVLLVGFAIVGGTYAYFFTVADTNNTLISNAADLSVVYTGGTNLTGNMKLVATKEEGYHTDVTIKLASSDTPSATADIFINIDAMTENLAIPGFKWEVYKNNSTIPYSTGNFVGYNDTTNNIVTIIDDYELSTNLTTFTIYLWLDGNDSTVGNNVLDGSFSGYIAATSETVTGILESHTVIFDANGGTVSTASKSVITGRAYGELPIPTREGYTFKGWNGKNKFNVTNDYTKSLNGISMSYDDSTQEFTINGQVSTSALIIFHRGPLDISPGDIITLSVINTAGTAIISGDTGITYAYAIFSQDYKKYIRSGNISMLTFPELYSFTGSMIEDSGGSNTEVMLQLWKNVTFNNYKIKIQIEKGSEVTAYEPYYLTNNTIVTQDKDHTLTAIWEANS